MLYFAFALFVLAIIPLINWNRRQESGFYLITLGSSLLVLYSIWTGFDVPWDPMTQAVAGLTIYLLSSVLWSTQYKQSIFDAVNLSACAFLFLTLRSLPPEISLSFVAITASGISTGLILDRLGIVSHDKLKYKIVDGNHKTFFGNTNHSGFYAAIGAAASGYLLINNQLPLIGLSCLAICGAGVLVSHCRGAIVGILVGVVLYGILTGYVLATLCLAGALVLVTWQALKMLGRMQSFTTSLRARLAYDIQTLWLIGRRPFFGWGLRTFRVHSPDVSRVLKRREWWNKLRSWGAENDPPEPIITHRVHCDPLEWAMETGLMGLGLLAIVAASLTWEDPFISAALVGIVVGSCFFYPFREAHLLPGILALAAVMAPAGSGIAGPWIEIAVTLSLLGMLKRFGTRFNGIAYLWRLKRARQARPKAIKEHVYLINKMLDCDPYNGQYLSYAAWFYFTILEDKGIAFKMSSRALENYDGEKVKHQQFDNYGKMALALGTAKIAQNAFNHALDIQPGYKPTLEALGVVRNMDKAMKTRLEKIQVKQRTNKHKKGKKNAKSSRYRKLGPDPAGG